MGSVMLLGGVVGRSSGSNWLLFLGGWIMLMINPRLIFDLSFQLSFASCLGLLWVKPKLDGLLPNTEGIGGWVTKFVRGSEVTAAVSAQAVTLPIVLFYFGRFSSVAILANILVGTVVPYIMVGGIGVLVVSYINMDIATLVGYWVYSLAHYLLLVTNWLGGDS